MPLIHQKHIFTKAFTILLFATSAFSHSLTNRKWSVDAIQHTGVKITGPDKASADFSMTFGIFMSVADPKPAKAEVSGVRYVGGTSWLASKPDANSGIANGKNQDWGDGFDPDIVSKPGTRTANLFSAAPIKVIRPISHKLDGKSIIFQFAKDPSFEFTARIDLNDQAAPPLLTINLKSLKKAFYSVSYLGAPAVAFDQTQEIWQPLIWQGRRFPAIPYLTAAYHCPIPTTLVYSSGKTIGVVAHPDETPFGPLPIFDNSRFGVAVRNLTGQAQPIIAAPILGGNGSKLAPGKSFSFRMHPYVTSGDTATAFERIARDIYSFRDVRHNQIGSLNQALENMIDYGMSDFSEFLEEEKGCSYATDAPGTVKNVSSLSPLEIALTTDDAEIWKRRTYPYIEFMLSRKKFLFTTNEQQKIQSPAYTLEGPVAPISELVALNRISNGSAKEMLDLAEAEYKSSRVRNLDVNEPGASWQNALHLYNASGKKEYLDQAIQGADAYIARRIAKLPEDFKDPDAKPQFWSGYAPRFIDLLLLHEASGEQRFLDASWKSARYYAMHCWMAPRIPDQEFIANIGGKAPVYSYVAKRTKGPIQLPAESVPAWRVSEQGLTCEAADTSTGHRAIFMANYAPFFLRIAWLKNDDFLRDIARSAIVGRWMNFPGYHINTGRSTVYEKADFPLRPFNELSYNSFHFNHIWPMMSLALDYLVTDAETRSNGAISFKREFIEGYAYLQSSLYAMRAGKFHDQTNVRLWIPRGLLKSSNRELNYITARSPSTLCLAFCNQSSSQEKSDLQLDTALLPDLKNQTRSARLWINNKQETSIQVINGAFSLTVPAKGIASIVIDDVKVKPRFQEGFSDLTAKDAWKTGLVDWTTPPARGMILNFGSAYRTFYFYLKNSKTDFKSLRLTYEIDGVTGTATDDSFPWEFTVPLSANARQLTYKLEATLPDGKTETFGPSTLAR